MSDEIRAEVARLRERLREVTEILIAEVGAEGPMDAEDAARKAVARMEAVQRSRSAERAAVVAYLRERANAPHPIERGAPSLSAPSRGLLNLMADRIERGEHIVDEEE
jgi:hypothetical protein